MNTKKDKDPINISNINQKDTSKDDKVNDNPTTPTEVVLNINPDGDNNSDNSDTFLDGINSK